MTEPDAVLRLWQQVEREVAEASSQADLVEEEIAAAQERWPGSRDALWHSWVLMTPTVTSKAWDTEWVYRGHVRELLDRVAHGQDTRLGTYAEIAMSIAAVALRVPLPAVGAALYFRAWHEAFPEHEIDAGQRVHLEALYGERASSLEHDLRRKLRQPRRLLEMAEITCDGMHWGEPAQCRWALPGRPGPAVRQPRSEEDPRSAGRTFRQR